MSIYTSQKNKICTPSPTATNLIAQRESLGVLSPTPVAEGDEQSMMFVAFSDTTNDLAKFLWLRRNASTIGYIVGRRWRQERRMLTSAASLVSGLGYG